MIQRIQLTRHRSQGCEWHGWGKTPGPVSLFVVSIFFTVTTFPRCSWSWNGELAWENSSW